MSDNRECAEAFERIVRLCLNQDEFGPLFDPEPTAEQMRELARMLRRMARAKDPVNTEGIDEWSTPIYEI